jgi:hypothetical protein
MSCTHWLPRVKAVFRQVLGFRNFANCCDGYETPALSAGRGRRLRHGLTWPVCAALYRHLTVLSPDLYRLHVSSRRPQMQTHR